MNRLLDIAILGSGNMGSALGRRFADAGHRVTYSFSRDPAKLERLARGSGPRARAATPREAAQDADLVLLAVHWTQMPEVLRAAGSLRGKIVLDLTNPMTAADDRLAVGHRKSGGELVARRARGASVVKAFNTVPAELLRAGPDILAEQPSVCYCGDDRKSKLAVARLIRQIGYEPVDCGPLETARYLEPLAMVIVELAYNQGHRPEVGLRVLRPGRKRGRARRA